MNKNKRNLIINFIFVILSCILSYYYLALPYLKECKDVMIPKNATCHHNMICFIQYCNSDADTCPLPCNSPKRWLLVSVIIILLSTCCSYLLILVIYSLLYKLCEIFHLCNKKNYNKINNERNNKNDEYSYLY